MCQLLGGMTSTGEAVFAVCMLLHNVRSFEKVGIMFSPQNGSIGIWSQGVYAIYCILDSMFNARGHMYLQKSCEQDDLS